MMPIFLMDRESAHMADIDFSDGTSAPFTVAGRINGFTFDTVSFTRQDEVVRDFYLTYH